MGKEECMNYLSIDTENILRNFNLQMKSFLVLHINCHQIFLKFLCICFLKMLTPSKAKNSRPW